MPNHAPAMRPLFDMYMKALPARKLATKTYFGHEGAFYPETMSFWGNYLDQGDLGYGTNRTSKPDGLTDNQYIRRYWQGGLELVAMMLDYHDLTQDAKFRDTTLIPFATEIVAFFDQHWPRGPDGKILFHPSQSLETWWDCTNPTPEIAGLRDVIPRLQQLGRNARLNRAWQKTLDDLPPVPLSADAPKRILPAEKFASKHNSENTELYAVFPYRLYTLAAGHEAIALARNTFAARRHRENGGWQQNSIQAALLGLADEARRCVTDSASRHAGDFRFPAMWGPNYDWTPDQDHGTVMMSALQRMLVQYDGRKILLLPAWPKSWNARFKLCVPYNTTVEGVVKGGKLTEWKTTPESRKKDVVILAAQ
jgi:alpha-L-fucosidase 2